MITNDMYYLFFFYLPIRRQIILMIILNKFRASLRIISYILSQNVITSYYICFRNFHTESHSSFFFIASVADSTSVL